MRRGRRWGVLLAAALALRCHAFFGYESQGVTDAGGAPPDAADAAGAPDAAPTGDRGVADLRRADARADSAGDLRPDAPSDAAAEAAPDAVADALAEGAPDLAPDSAPLDSAPLDSAPGDSAPGDSAPLDSGADAASDGGCGQTVMISEVMINPKGNDPAGEWFELHNGTAAAVALHGWTIADKDASHTIDAPALTIPPQGYLVLMAASAAVAPPAYVYSNGTACATEICFANDSDRVELYDSGGTLVDQVIYGSAFPFGDGASMSLRAPCLDNGVAASWCTESVLYSGTPKNAGTPGAAAACP